MNGSFRVTPEEAKKAIEEYLNRKRDDSPPAIDFRRLAFGPEEVLMPKFHKKTQTHVPIQPEQD